MDILKEPKPSRVFIVQDQFKRHPDNDSLVSKFDFTQAKPFGDLVYLLKPNANPFSPNEGVVAELTDKLHDYGPNDFLLLTGNPILIGWVTAIAAKMNNGKVRLLQWNGRRGLYLEVRGNLYQFT
jgi:hypothetical protein